MYKIIGSDQKEYGPVSTDLVRQWLKDGRLGRQSPVQAEGSSEWKPLGNVPEFADLFPPAAPPLAGSATGTGSRTSGLAIASLILGPLGLFTCGIAALVGLILGIIGLVKIKRSGGQLSGDGLAISGICVSGAILLVAIPLTAAMFLPALSQAKARAQTINCVNNVKQLGLAARLYASEHNDSLPSITTWCDDLQKYVKAPNIFQCPVESSRRCSYAINARLDGKKLSEVNPQTVLFFESDAGWNGSGGPESLVLGRHRQMVVVGFADGSVRQMLRSQVGSLRWGP